MINVALIGYGLGGKVFHAPLVNVAGNLNLYGVCSRTEEKRSQAKSDYPDVVTYSDYEMVLSDENVDLVVLATPHDTHHPMSILALESGKHVVTDKVMCLNEAEAEEMIEASLRNRVVLSIFQNRRWDGDFLTLQMILSQGSMGDIYTIESNITSFGGPHRGWRAWKAQGGGRTRDWGAHLVDQAIQLFGPTVISVFADHQFHWAEETGDVESSCLAQLTFKNGVRFFIELGADWAFPKPRYHVRGQKGSFRKYGLDPQEAAMKLGTIGLAIPEDRERYQLRLGDSGGTMREVSIQPIQGRYRTYYDNVGEVLAGDAELLVKPEECLEAIRVIDAIFEAAESGSVVQLDGK